MSNSQQNIDFQVRKHDFHETRSLESSAPPEGDVVVRVNSFAFTANNITYAAYGDILGYWQFYPAEDGWGRIPVWGFADVVSSNRPELKAGERLFGYWPMSRYAVLNPSHIDAGTVIEGAPQRQELNPFYNRYQRCAVDPAYVASDEDWHSIFRPLGLTGFLLDEYLAENEFWGATSVILSSASSKTAYSLAHFLHERANCKVVGLTSAANVDFANKLGCYDQLVEYADIEQQPAETPTVFVDMAGNTDVLTRVHTHFDSALKKSVTVGGTHWNAIAQPGALPGPEPEFFFAPSHIEARIKAWGPAGFQQRFAAAWSGLLPKVKAGIDLVNAKGVDELEDVYRAMVNGKAEADKGYIVKL